MTRWATAFVLAFCSTFGASVNAQDTTPAGRAVFAAVERFAAARTQIQAELGIDEAGDLQRRLFSDLELQNEPAPEGATVADWAETLREAARLDVEVVDELIAGTPPPLQLRPGLHETLVRSRVDGRWQLVAIYVPALHGARAPLAIALHGNPQTESQLLGMPYLRRLADRTGTIIAAPYGRGLYDYAEPAATDVYDLLAALQSAFPVDRGRTYLVGYSMGGFTVFKIGPRGGYRWSAALCISGAILNSGVRPVTVAWQSLPIYVVTGANDTSIPARYGEQTAAYLAGIGLPVSFYEEAKGTHAMRTLTPSLARAWDDMHASLVRPENVPTPRGIGGLAQNAPISPTKP